MEELTLKLAQHLRSRGDEVRVLTNRWPADLPAEDVVDAVPVMRLGLTLPGLRPAAMLRHYGRRGAVLRAMDALGPAPDIVHIQCASSQTWFARQYTRRHGVPLVLTTQGETEMDAGRIYQRSTWLRSELRRAAEQAAVLTACSAWTRDQVQRYAPAFDHARVVPNGVEPADWDMAEQVAAPVLAAWGRLVPQKGFDLLVEAFRLVRESLPSARLLLAGAGHPSGAGVHLPEPGVSFLGPLDRAGVRDLLAQARVAVVPSRIEPFGIVALEALAAGRGLVYSSRGGLADAAGDCGRSADPFDRAAFAAAVLAELQEPTSAARGRARAEQLSWSRVGGQYEVLYDEVLTGREVRPG